MDRKLSNPLALAILAQLEERPMHPYEIAFQMRTRRLENSIKLNYGSLYSTIEALLRDGYIVVQDVQRDGRRPERTIYAITEKGSAVFLDWLRHMLSTPVNEFAPLAAGLSFVGRLSPDEVDALCAARIAALTDVIGELEYVIDAIAGKGLDRLFGLETEYQLAQRRCEMEWMRGLRRDIAGALTTMRDGRRVWTAPARPEDTPFGEKALDKHTLDEGSDERQGRATRQRHASRSCPAIDNQVALD